MSKSKTSKMEPDNPRPEVSSDYLLDCLVFLTKRFGRAKSADAIRAGLAYDDKGMGPELFCEASKRLGFKTKITRRKTIDKIPVPVLPAVLILKDNKACVLDRIDKSKNSAWIYSPKDAQILKINLDKLENKYAGYAILFHPEETRISDSGKKISDTSWFWETMLENKGIYGQVVLAAVLVNLFALASPLFIMTVYDRVIPNEAIETGWVLAIGAFTVYLFDFTVRTIRGYYIDMAGRKIDIISARRIFDQVMDMKLAARPASSGVFANMLRDFDTVRDFLTSASLTAFVDLPFSIFFLFVIWLLGGPIAFVLAALIIIVLVSGLIIQIPLRQKVRKSVRSAEAKHGLLVEAIHGLETIKAIRADGRMRARYGEMAGENAMWGQKSRFLSSVGVNIAALLQQSATIFVVLVGMYLVKDASISMGGLIASVILGGRAIAPIGQVANLMARYHQASSAYKTIEEVMSKPVERPVGKQFLHRPDLKGKISFNKVCFSYPSSGRRILEDISFSVNAGEKVGIIGRVGSGKSTLARLVLGLYEPEEGTILIDDTDHRQIDPADLRRSIGYIAQDVVLFSGSVRDNITIGKPHATEEEILAASMKAGVHEFIQLHPMGYDASVGERGEGLSGGQRQAVALARAMLCNPVMLVCDEPTNSMDIQAEESFRSHISRQPKENTLILITHRQQLLSLVDRVIIIDQGKVVMDGKRDDVMNALASGGVKVPSKGGQP